MARKQKKTPFVTRLEDVPQGYVALADFARGLSKALYRALTEAHGAGVVAAVKYAPSAGFVRTGPVFVDPVQATAFIAEYKTRSRVAKKRDEEDEHPADVAVVEPFPAVAVDPESAAELRSLVCDLRRDMAAMREEHARATAALVEQVHSMAAEVSRLVEAFK